VVGARLHVRKGRPVPRELASMRLRTGTSRRNAVAVFAVVDFLRCCDGHVVGHVLEGRVCRGGGARELEAVGAAVLETTTMSAVACTNPEEESGRWKQCAMEVLRSASEGPEH
jgi:hypothetical protein